MVRSFSCVLCELRRARGYSQRKAAADLHISQALLSHYENGAREPGLHFVCLACDYYGVSADYLLGRIDSVDGSVGEIKAKAKGLSDALREHAAALDALADSASHLL